MKIYILIKHHLYFTVNSRPDYYFDLLQGPNAYVFLTCRAYTDMEYVFNLFVIVTRTPTSHAYYQLHERTPLRLTTRN